MIRRLYVLCAIATSSIILSCRISAKEIADSILSDFDVFIEHLTDTHPDPYTAFGGRALFFSKVSDMRASLKSNPTLSKSVLADSLTSLTSKLGDGHTSVYNSLGNNNNDDLFAVGHISWSQDSIFLLSLHRDNSHLLGARINKIGGVDVDEAIKGAISKTAAENRYGTIGWPGFKPKSVWQKMFRGLEDDVNLEIISVEGDTADYIMPLRPVSELNSFDYARLPHNPSVPRGLFQYKLVDSDKKVMMISVPTIAARENFEYCYNRGVDFVNWMRGLYGYLGRQAPTDTLEAINGFPSYYEKFKDMLSAMKKDSVPYLIIDLRGNGGGWSPIVKPTLMLLYGDKYVKSTRDEHELYIQRISPLFLKKNNMSIDEYNKEQGTNLKINDYSIGRAAIFPDDSIEYYRNEMIDGFMLPETDKIFLKDLKGQPFYEPERVFVVTDPGTFSAAFHYTFFLKRAGAEVVGVTSSQAPNTFMETTNFTLPYTGIRGSISNSQQILLSPSDPRSKEFTPDFPTDYSIYRKYGFNIDTPISYIIDIIESD